MDVKALQTLLERIRGVRIAVVGDVMVDRFVHGEVARVSPEAPIPVLAATHEAVMLGGAGNVARNLSSLGGEATLAGMVGDDAPGREALGLLGDEAGIEGHLVTRPRRRTTVKTRFVASGQQLLRLDSEDSGALSSEAESSLLGAVRHACDAAKAILISDYAKGAVSDAVVRACVEAARTSGAIVVVDPKGRNFARYGAVDLIKPNASELAGATDMAAETDAEVEAALAKALDGCTASAILVTRAGRGMSIAVRGEAVRHVRARPREVFDVSGAGDTALAALGLALGAGGSLDEAAAFAIAASGVAVERAGTATVSPEELVEAEMTARATVAEAKLATPERMVETVARWRALGFKVGFTNGCFDVLHRGHTAYLAQARSWCDRLIVGLNSDASVQGLKGEGRPVNDLAARAEVLAALASVDLVVPFDAETPLALIEASKPDVLVKGSDYTVNQVVGADVVLAGGGEVKLADFVEGWSTTEAIARMKRA